MTFVLTPAAITSPTVDLSNSGRYSQCLSGSRCLSTPSSRTSPPPLHPCKCTRPLPHPLPGKLSPHKQAESGAVIGREPDCTPGWANGRRAYRVRGDGGHAACTVQSAAARLLHLVHRPQKVKNKPLDYWQKLERDYTIGPGVAGGPDTFYRKE